MAYEDDLITARDNLAEELRRESARRLALVTAGKPPPTTYSANGRSVSWNEYIKTMSEEIKRLTDQIDDAESEEADPFELPMTGFTL